MDRLRVGLLGRLEVRRGGLELDLGQRQQQVLFALLLARGGRLVQLPEIIELIWGTDPPPTATNMVHRYVSGLRRLLGAGRHILREPGGYRLEPGGLDVDLVRFRERTDAARTAGAAGDFDTALDHLIEGLRLWRGRCAAGLTPAAGVHPDFASIDREFSTAAREAARIARMVARDGEVLPEVREAARRDPVDEALQAGLLLALSASGQQAEALSRYGDLRDRLADDLGVDPGPELTAAYETALRAGGPGPVVPRARPAVRPAQLPSDFRLFAGRPEMIGAALTGLLGHPAAMPIVAFDGMPGVGKSTLAVHVAHRAANGFPDGQLYADLHGFDGQGRVTDPADVLTGFLGALGVQPDAVPPSLDARASLFRSVLAGRRMLVVLDNARDAEHVRPLLPGSAGNAVLVTSRSPLAGLAATHGAQLWSVGLPDLAEARTVVARHIGAHRAQREQAALDEIIGWCGRLPLAMSIVAARAAADAERPLSELATALRQLPHRLDVVDDEHLDQDVRAVFSWSYRLLSRGAARLFRLLPWHVAPDFTVEIAAGLAGDAPATVRGQLAELVGTGLLHRHRPARYRLHDLVRAYGRELGARTESPGELDRAQDRLFHHYLHSAAAAVGLLRPGYAPVTLPPVPGGVTPLTFCDEAAVMDWSVREKENLGAVVAEAAGRPTGPPPWPLALLVKDLYHRHGWWPEWTAMFTMALGAAERSGDVTGRAHTHRGLAVACHYVGDPAAADHHLGTALGLFDSTGDVLGRALVLMNQGYLAQLRGDDRSAQRLLPQALEVFRRTGQRQLEGVVLATLAESHLAAGDPVTAAALARRAARLCHEIRDAWNGARAAGTLARIHRRDRDFVTAIRLHQHSIDLMLRRNAELEAAHHRNELGDTLLAAGDTEAAHQTWTRVASTFTGAPSARPAVAARARLAS